MTHCSVCQHPKIAEINQAIVTNVTLRDIASQFKIGYMSVKRHKDAGHIPQALAKAQEAKEIAKSDDLLKWTKGILSKSISYMNQAEGAGDLRTAIAGVREARGCVELLGKVMGELGPNSQTAVQVNVGIQSITTSPEWPVLVRVLDRHPEIRQELTEALQGAKL